MATQLSHNVILFGQKSSGKTYFGRLLSQEMNYPFVDTDQWIQELYSAESGEEFSCRQIACKIGENGFRLIERRVINALDRLHAAVIAIGGGTMLCPENLAALKTLGQLVYLDTDKEIVRQRIFKGELPSFFCAEDPYKSFEAMYESRKQVFERIEALHITVSGKTDRQVLEEITTRLNCRS